MSNSLQLPVRLIFLVFCAVFIILQNASAFEFGVSPAELSFEGKENQKICKTASIFSSINKINISVGDKWAEDEKADKKISLYKIGKEELNIFLEYENNFILNRKKEIEVCLKSNAGNFKGILIFEALNKSLSIGIWLNADISKNSQTSKITDFSVVNSDNFNMIKIPLAITAFNLFLLLGLILFYSRRKFIHKKSNN